ncbi:MAG: hypothetical protein JNK29_19880 [Anaerolineales bacterium]|nr:hypothetical protein [Anaerolineales bacterium]
MPPSPTPPATPTPLAGPLALFTFTSYGFFGGLYAGLEPSTGWVWDEYSELGFTSASSPASARQVAFAHFAPRLAYLIVDAPTAQLWIADLTLSEPRLIVDDQAGLIFPTNGFDEIGLRWSADDQHLFVQLPSLEDNFVVHALTGAREPWPWICNQVAASPRSGRLAEWCAPIQVGGDWAVVEWGGPIWLSGSAPVQPVVRLSIGEQQPRWAWSADGAQVAYFTSAAGRADVHIADITGDRPFASAVYQPRAEASFGLQWSQDSRRLMLRRDPADGHACLEYHLPLAEPDQAPVMPPCWQVLDTISGQTLWSLGDAAGAFTPALSPLDLVHWNFSLARLAPDGRRLAVLAEYPLKRAGLILNWETGDILGGFPGPVEALGWGPLP